MSAAVLMEEESKKVSIFLHVTDKCVLDSYVPSIIYKLELDVNKYLNPSPDLKIPQNPSSSSSSIRSIFRFSCKEKLYPVGMSCVLLGSKLYFMGGSISYVVRLLELYDYDKELEDTKYYDTGTIDVPLTNFAKESLDSYPSLVYVFDCDTCTLMPEEDFIPPMKSGKGENPFTFVVNDQIFVLSSKKAAPGMVLFETINPNQWKEWKELEEPPKVFLYPFEYESFPVGSALVKGKFLITFKLYPDFYMLSYDIKSGKWATHISTYLPQMYRGAVFVRDTFYSALSEPLEHNFKDKYIFPVISFGPLDSTLLDQEGINVDDVLLSCFKKYSFHGKHAPISPEDIRNWPIYSNQKGFSTRCFFHLGGLLKGTDNTSRCFGFVELFERSSRSDEPDWDTQCELRVVVFEAAPNDNSSDVHTPFHATTIDAYHLSTDIYGLYRLGAAFAYLA